MTPLGSVFQLTIAREAPRAIVTVTGELDLATAPKLARALEDLPAELRDIRLLLDDVWFVDATALARLLRSGRRLEALGRTLTFVSAGDAATAALRAAGVAIGTPAGAARRADAA